MSLQIGIVGLPNAGKSTLFNALLGQQAAEAQNFPFTTIDPNVGVVDVPDERLQKLAELVQPKRIVPATVQFVDIAGIVKGASQGEGLGNKFLANIREVDAIAIVVRAFEDPNIIHVNGTVNAADDLSVIIAELLLADLDSVERQIKLAENKVKSGDKEAAEQLRLLGILKIDLASERVPDLTQFGDDERKIIKRFNLLTAKPFIVVPNVAETELAKLGAVMDEISPAGRNDASSRVPQEIPTALETIMNAAQQLIGTTTVVPISAKIEAELGELEPTEQAAYLEELGVHDSGLTRLIQTAFATLGLQTYFTAGPEEVRAWTIHQGDTAPKAAGVIHGDFERGFIAAETVSFNDFVTVGGWSEAKAKGLAHTEGKTYVVKDGDVMLFRFNV